MGPTWTWAGLAALIAVVFAALWLRSARDARQYQTLLRAAEQKLEQVQRQFQRFVPEDVVERLTDSADFLMPERRQVTMLFADLRGFTALCDQLDPAVTVKMLNDYFSHMQRAIVRHHGHVTEFVGDGLLALFGALEPNPWQARDAVLAALDMRTELQRYNETLRTQDLPELRFGIGIHGGEVVAGVIGTAGLAKFSVTGDPINVASRIEGLTSKLQVDLLITEDIRRLIGNEFDLQPMPPSIVKGKAEPIQTYRVQSLSNDGSPVAPRAGHP
jgi:class 3 adenylate cyclase